MKDMFYLISFMSLFAIAVTATLIFSSKEFHDICCFATRGKQAPPWEWKRFSPLHVSVQLQWLESCYFKGKQTCFVSLKKEVNEYQS